MLHRVLSLSLSTAGNHLAQRVNQQTSNANRNKIIAQPTRKTIKTTAKKAKKKKIKHLLITTLLSIEIYTCQVWQYIPLVPRLRKQEQVNLYEFKVSQSHRARACLGTNYLSKQTISILATYLLSGCSILNSHGTFSITYQILDHKKKVSTM